MIKSAIWRVVLTLTLALMPMPAFAGPYLGDWGWFWRPAPECPRGCYSWLHYWAPTAYRVRAHVHPAYLDQYPPGACVNPSYDYHKHPCRSSPPVLSPAYGDPEAYYGRPVAPPQP